MLSHAITAGTLLLEVKKELAHGEFGDWCREHLEFGEATARNYMRLAKRQRVVDLDPELSIRAALAEIESRPKSDDTFRTQPMTPDEAEKVLGMARMAETGDYNAARYMQLAKRQTSADLDPSMSIRAARYMRLAKSLTHERIDPALSIRAALDAIADRPALPQQPPRSGRGGWLSLA